MKKKNKNSRQFLILASILVLNLFGVPKINAQTQGIRLKDEVRRMTLFVPEGVDKSTPSALVISFHGSGTTALEHMFYTEMNETASKEKFIVAYPQGKNNDWNVGFEQDYNSGNDIEFIDSLLHKLKKHYTIKEDQVFAVGLSRGGFFVQRLAAELPDTFAAIASVGAPLSNLVQENMPPELSMGFLLAHGVSDQVVLYGGEDGDYLGAEDCIADWKNRNAIISGVTILLEDSSADGTSIEIQEYGDSKKVTLMKIENGGHTWPGANDFNIGFPLGLTTHDIDFNQYLWSFFQSNVPKK